MLKYFYTILLSASVLYVFGSDNVTYNASFYKFNIQNSSCYELVTNDRNILYVASGKGLLVFNGFKWDLISESGPCYNILPFKDSLYYVGDNFIGVIKVQNSKLNIKKNYFKNFYFPSGSNTRLLYSSNSLYFFKQPYLYSIKGNKLFLVDSTSKVLRNVGNNLFIINTRGELSRVIGERVIKSKVLRGYKFHSFINSSEKLWLLSDDKNEIFSVDTGKHVKVETIATPFFKNIVKGVVLPGNNIFFETKNRTYHLFDSHIGVLHTLNLESQVITGLTTSIHVDNNQNIWLLYNHGVNRVSLFDCINEYTSPDFIKSKNFVLFNNQVLYSVFNRLYFLNEKRTELSFPDEIEQILSLNNYLIVQSKNAIFSVNQKWEISLIFSGSCDFLQANNGQHDNFYFKSGSRLLIYYQTDYGWTTREIYNKIPGAIRSIIETDNKLYLLDGIGNISILAGNNLNFIKPVYDTNSDVPNLPWDKLFSVHNKIYLQNSEFIYEMDPSGKLKKLTLYEEFKSRNLNIADVKLNSDNTIFITAYIIGEPKVRIYYGSDDKEHSFNTLLRMPLYLKEGINIDKVFPLGKSKVLFAGDDKVFLFDMSAYQKNKGRVNLVINKIIIAEDSIIFNNIAGLSSGPEKVLIENEAEDLTIEFFTPTFQDPSDVQYSYFLQGSGKTWSDWQNIPYAKFNKIRRGTYTFMVKSKAENHNISSVCSFQVKVKKPFYLSNFAYTLYFLFFLLAVVVYLFRRKRSFDAEKLKLERIINERTAELQREKEKTDELLANLLPKETVNELKNTGKATSQKFDMVTVLFSDIQGFTKIAEHMNPEKLIDELDNFFFYFDSVVEKYNIEKIKTIGDAYMCAGGIPYKNRTNPVEVVLAALEVQDYMRRLKQKDLNIWDLRIGIHTGAIIAGVVGHKRLSYDIWGDTVNTASRMESSGEAGKINISGHTYELVKEFFICEYRGRMPVKYKGDVDMYFVKGIRPELSIDMKVIPNKKFFTLLQILRLNDLEEFIIERLNAELSNHFYFHNAKHTKEIYTQVELLGRAEEISQEELLLVRTAALFVDTGFMFNFLNYLNECIRYAREILPKFRYTPEQIEIICQLIQSSGSTDSNPSKLESIIIDSCYNYYGRVDYIDCITKLLKELKYHIQDINDVTWYTDQIQKIRNFKFHTYTATYLSDIQPDRQIQKIKDYLK